jgi:hypothetical protein
MHSTKQTGIDHKNKPQNNKIGNNLPKRENHLIVAQMKFAENQQKNIAS